MIVDFVDEHGSRCPANGSLTRHLDWRRDKPRERLALAHMTLHASAPAVEHRPVDHALIQIGGKLLWVFNRMRSPINNTCKMKHFCADFSRIMDIRYTIVFYYNIKIHR
jgi:hypothetical protein